jgi:hypothetical protein
VTSGSFGLFFELWVDSNTLGGSMAPLTGYQWSKSAACHRTNSMCNYTNSTAARFTNFNVSQTLIYETLMAPHGCHSKEPVSLYQNPVSIFQFRYEPEGGSIWVASGCGLTGLKKEV